jgi:hypothetical protein
MPAATVALLHKLCGRFLSFSVGIILSLCWLSSCSKNKDLEEGATPSFVVTKVWLAGVFSSGSKVPYVKSFTLRIRHCSNSLDNRRVTVTLLPGDSHLENLHKGSRGCLFVLESFVVSGESDETYAPATTAAAVQGTSVVYSTQGGKEASVVAENLPGEKLAHDETLSFSVMPAFEENRFAVAASQLEFGDSANVPKLFLSEIGDDGPVSDANSHGIFVYLDCDEIPEGSTCGGQSLLEMRFRYVKDPTGTPTEDEVRSLFASQVIVPSRNHLYGTGLRLFLAVPNNDDGSPVATLGFAARYSDSYRYFLVDLSGLLDAN